MLLLQGVGSNNTRVLVLAATNLPYNLDQVGAWGWVLGLYAEAGC